MGVIRRAGGEMASGDHAVQGEIYFPKSQLSVQPLMALLRPDRCHKPPLRSGFGGGGMPNWGRLLSDTSKTQTRSELRDPFIIMELAFPHRPPKVEVGQSGPSRKQPEPTCSSYSSPDERLCRKPIYSPPAS